MKQISYLSMVFVVAMACSKSDSPPALENAKVTTTTVQVPSGLTTAASTNTYAANVNELISYVNTMTNWSNMFVVPTGATKTSSTIKASNGRVSSTSSSSVTYTWTDKQMGYSVALQITDDGTSYLWEYFIKLTPTSDWLKYVDATEKKDGSTGVLRVFDAEGSDPSVIFLKYEWNKVGDVYTFKYTTDTFRFVLTMSVATKAGTIDYYYDNVIAFKYSWGTDGHGSWQVFDSQGVLSDNGSW